MMNSTVFATAFASVVSIITIAVWLLYVPHIYLDVGEIRRTLDQDMNEFHSASNLIWEEMMKLDSNRVRRNAYGHPPVGYHEPPPMRQVFEPYGGHRNPYGGGGVQHPSDQMRGPNMKVAFGGQEPNRGDMKPGISLGDGAPEKPGPIDKPNFQEKEGPSDAKPLPDNIQTFDETELKTGGFTGEDFATGGHDMQHSKCQCSDENKCPAGPPGPPGAPGLPGEDGKDGAPGKPGADAEDQHSTYQMPAGCVFCMSCVGGPNGPAGIPGPQGMIGAPGRPGAPAANGSPGYPGDIGPIGEKGREGSRGIKGTPGKDATYEVPVKGVKGPKGERGLVGDQGERGVDGEIGEMGVKGEVGVEGPQGPPGTRGDTGPGGIPGVPGPDSFYCPCPARTPVLKKAKT